MTDDDGPWTVMEDYASHEAARRDFEWDLPEAFNPAVDFLRKHDDPGRIALEQAYPDGRRETYTFADLDRQSSRPA